MKISLACACLGLVIFTGGCVKSRDSSSVDSSKKELAQFLGTDVEVNTATAPFSIEYCPDNTCEVFKTQDEKTSISDLIDFSHIYLFYVSGYAALDDARTRSEVRTSARMALERHAEECKGATEDATVKCVLRTLSRQHSLRVMSVRYDENKKVEDPIDLEAALRRMDVR